MMNNNNDGNLETIARDVKCIVDLFEEQVAFIRSIIRVIKSIFRMAWLSIKYSLMIIIVLVVGLIGYYSLTESNKKADKPSASEAAPHVKSSLELEYELMDKKLDEIMKENDLLFPPKKL